MKTYITEISRQTVTIDGITYKAEDATAKDNTPSRMQALFRQQYGKDSFHSALADLLAEWFDSSERLNVQTSGSTGVPKVLSVEKRRMINSAMMTVSFLNLKADDTALLCMPLRYIAGKMVVVRALVAGLNLIPVTPCGHPLKGLENAPVFAAMIPMQVFNSLSVHDEKVLLTRITHLIIGGGAIDVQMEEELKDFPNAVWSTYGMTETLSHIAMRRLNGSEASHWYTPFSHVKITLSESGTLVINAPDVSEETLLTNDIAEIDSEGHFRIIGRRDNTINTGGVKVQTEEIEAALRPHLSHPFMITSVPDPKFGERIVLLVQDTIYPEEMEEAFSALPPYWRPKQTVKTEKLPMTETGKPDRSSARRIACNLTNDGK